MGVKNAPQSQLDPKVAPAQQVLDERLTNLNTFFTYSLYENVCRSLFEKHKLLFSFLLTNRILDGSKMMNAFEWRYLLQGPTGDIPLAVNPTTWISENQWPDVYRQFYTMEREIEVFKGVLPDFMENSERFKEIFDAQQPQEIPPPAPWDDRLDTFEKIILLKTMRSDKLVPAI
jgi:dynein heavy chain